jgi:hypothetical protein
VTTPPAPARPAIADIVRATDAALDVLLKAAALAVAAGAWVTVEDLRLEIVHYRERRQALVHEFIAACDHAATLALQTGDTHAPKD